MRSIFYVPTNEQEVLHKIDTMKKKGKFSSYIVGLIKRDLEKENIENIIRSIVKGEI